MGTLGSLCCLPSLCLNLSYSSVNDNELISLLKFNQLEGLNISCCPFVTKNVAEFIAKSNLSNLKKLNVMRLNFTEEELLGIAAGAGVTVLYGEAVTERVRARLGENRDRDGQRK